MQHGTELRSPVESDRTQLEELLTLSWRRFWGPHVSEQTREAFEREQPAIAYVDACWSEFLVATRHGVVAGMAHCIDDFLAALHVHPQNHREGIGGILLSAAETQGAAKLHVRAFNLNAIRFYEQRGWTVVRTFDDDEYGTLLLTHEMHRLRSPTDEQA